MTHTEITSIITTFIQNLPAILTALAPVISAIGGLATVVAARRVIRNQDKLPPSSDA